MGSYENLAYIYDKLIFEDIDYDIITSFILKVLEDHNIKRDKYLDVACGTGTMVEKMYKFFQEVWAVDYSLDMLSAAEQKLRDKKVSYKLINQNMIELELYEKFDLITCILDAVNYIDDSDDIEKFFKRVHEHLEDEGAFIFDINSYYKLSEVLGNNTFIYDTEELFYSWENEFDEDTLYMYLNFFLKEGGVYKRFQEEHRERAYKEAFIEEALKIAGFKIIGKTEDYRYCKSVTEVSERLVYIVKKENNNG